MPEDKDPFRSVIQGAETSRRACEAWAAECDEKALLEAREAAKWPESSVMRAFHERHAREWRDAARAWIDQAQESAEWADRLREMAFERQIGPIEFRAPGPREPG